MEMRIINKAIENRFVSHSSPLSFSEFINDAEMQLLLIAESISEKHGLLDDFRQLIVRPLSKTIFVIFPNNNKLAPCDLQNIIFEDGNKFAICDLHKIYQTYGAINFQSAIIEGDLFYNLKLLWSERKEYFKPPKKSS